MRGKAQGDDEVFEFTIEPFVTGGYRLDIRYYGSCHHNIAGAGIRPTEEKARQIAEETAIRLLQGAKVDWKPLS